MKKSTEHLYTEFYNYVVKNNPTATKKRIKQAFKIFLKKKGLV